MSPPDATPPPGEGAGAPVTAAEREAALARLREAAAEGRFTLEELAARVEAVRDAGSAQELDRITSDLPAPAPADSGRPGGTRRVLGILGGNDRRGRWRIARRCTVVNILGGSELDLRQAIVEDVETDVLVFSLMGGATITVPQGVVVELGGLALLGGNSLRAEGRPTAPGAPVVRVRAYSVFGGTTVVTPDA